MIEDKRCLIERRSLNEGDKNVWLNDNRERTMVGTNAAVWKINVKTCLNNVRLQNNKKGGLSLENKQVVTNVARWIKGTDKVITSKESISVSHLIIQEEAIMKNVSIKVNKIIHLNEKNKPENTHQILKKNITNKKDNLITDSNVQGKSLVNRIIKGSRITSERIKIYQE